MGDDFCKWASSEDVWVLGHDSSATKVYAPNIPLLATFQVWRVRKCRSTWARFNTSSSAHFHHLVHSHSFVLHIVKSKNMDVLRGNARADEQTQTSAPVLISIISFFRFLNSGKWTIAEHPTTFPDWQERKKEYEHTLTVCWHHLQHSHTKVWKLWTKTFVSVSGKHLSLQCSVKCT